MAQINEFGGEPEADSEVLTKCSSLTFLDTQACGYEDFVPSANN
jgi:hypothetical protein